MERTEAKAVAKTIRIAPRKTRLIIDLIRGKSVNEAFAILRNQPQRAARVIEKVLKSAVANADHNYQMEVEKLFVKEIYANEGITMKRFLPKAKGSASKLLKRTSNITVVVAEKN